jgi:hypothetical protein
VARSDGKGEVEDKVSTSELESDGIGPYSNGGQGIGREDSCKEEAARCRPS